MPPSKKNKLIARQPVRNDLGNDELSHILQFVMAHDNSCKVAEAFLSIFAKPGIWRVAAQKLGWGSTVQTRQQFVDRCIKERQNTLASLYDEDMVLTQAQKRDNLNARWEPTNAWVVPGFVFNEPSMKGPQGGVPHVLLGVKGKQKVILTDEYGHERQAVALVETGPRGTRYAVKLAGKYGNYLLLQRRS